MESWCAKPNTPNHWANKLGGGRGVGKKFTLGKGIRDYYGEEKNGQEIRMTKLKKEALMRGTVG